MICEECLTIVKWPYEKSSAAWRARFATSYMVLNLKRLTYCTDIRNKLQDHRRSELGLQVGGGRSTLGSDPTLGDGHFIYGFHGVVLVAIRQLQSARGRNGEKKGREAASGDEEEGLRGRGNTNLESRGIGVCCCNCCRGPGSELRPDHTI